MGVVNYLHYFLINLFGYHKLPCFIKHGGYEWHNIVFRGMSDKRWRIYYSRFNGNGSHGTEELIDVRSRFKYIAFLKTVLVLWKWRKRISFTIDNY